MALYLQSIVGRRRPSHGTRDPLGCARCNICADLCSLIGFLITGSAGLLYSGITGHLPPLPSFFRHKDLRFLFILRLQSWFLLVIGPLCRGEQVRQGNFSPLPKVVRHPEPGRKSITVNVSSFALVCIGDKRCCPASCSTHTSFGGEGNFSHPLLFT